MKKERIIELIDERLEEPNSMDREWVKALRKIRGKLMKKQSADKPLTINKMVKEAHETAKEHGWWEEERSFGEQIALIHSELSEALEEARDDSAMDLIYYFNDRNGNPKPCGIPTELADAVIRIADLCGHYGIDLDNAIKIKMQYNKGREYKHGKVF